VHRRPSQATELREIITEITEDAKRASQILEECSENVGPGGLHFRFSIVAQSFWALGGGPKELEQLANSLERGRHSIIEQNSIMQSFGLNALLLHANSPSRRSPSPRKIRKDISILFVDDVNKSKSDMTMACSELVLSICHQADQSSHKPTQNLCESGQQERGIPGA
jgi:hypothetical protein